MSIVICESGLSVCSLDSERFVSQGVFHSIFSLYYAFLVLRSTLHRECHRGLNGCFFSRGYTTDFNNYWHVQKKKKKWLFLWVTLHSLFSGPVGHGVALAVCLCWLMEVNPFLPAHTYTVRECSGLFWIWPLKTACIPKLDYCGNWKDGNAQKDNFASELFADLSFSLINNKAQILKSVQF